MRKDTEREKRKMFLEKIEKFNPNYESLNSTSNSELICTVKSPSCVMVQFFPTYVTLKKDGTQKNFDYDEFAAISVKKLVQIYLSL